MKKLGIDWDVDLQDKIYLFFIYSSIRLFERYVFNLYCNPGIICLL